MTIVELLPDHGPGGFPSFLVLSVVKRAKSVDKCEREGTIIVTKQKLWSNLMKIWAKSKFHEKAN